jgi:membrane protein
VSTALDRRDARGVPARVRRRLSLIRVLATVTGVRIIRNAGSVAVAAARNGWRHRVLGLSAEAGFWQLLSLPSAALGLLGTIGYMRGWLGTETINDLKTHILDAANRVLSTDTVNNSIRKTLDTVLAGGRADVISIGFVLSLWSGSSAMATFVNTITIAYDQRDLRSAVRSRLRALAMYVVAMLAGIVLLPTLVVGPTALGRIPVIARHDWAQTAVHVSYYPVAVLLSLAALASLYHQALPVKPPWRHTIPGALTAAGLWVVGAYGLRVYVVYVFKRTLDYGALASPVAVLLFFYITALAVLLGAEVNAEMDRRRHARQAAAAVTGDAPAPPPLGEHPDPAQT